MEELKSKLEQFNSSFKFKAGEFVKRLNETNQSRLINKILSDMDESLTQLEQERNFNFLSFIYFVRKDINLAHECNSKVLKLNPKNMIAKANKAWFLVDNPKEVTNLEDLLAELDDLKQDRLINLVAKAEVAYTFSRLGATQYRTADKLFREIHEECFLVNPHRSDDQIPKEYVYIWTFGYCLTQRRLLHFGSMPEGHEMQPSKQDYKRLLETLLQVTSMERTLKPNLQKSRLYVELGMVIKIIEGNKEDYPNGLQSIFTETEILSKFKPARIYFKQARLHQPKDIYILDKCGQYYRRVNNLKQSIKFLRASLDIKPNSLAFHHLGVAYKKQLEKTIKRNVNWEPDEDGLIGAWTPGGPKSKQLTASNRKQRKSESQIKKLIKNPYTLLAIDLKEHSETVDKILDCFDKAVGITGNKPALYDKGLLFRQTRQFDKALEVFEQIIRDEDSTSTLFNKANAYEQSALCIASLIKRNSGDDGRFSTRTMKIYLKSVLEISCKLSCRIPKVKTCWKAATILKEKLLGQPDTKDKLEYLRIAYEHEENYEDLLKVLEELLKCEREVSKKAQLVEKKVLCHTKLNNFDEAILSLEKFKNTYGIESIQEKFYKSVNVEAGLHAFKAHEPCKTSLRLRNAFDFGKTIKETGNEAGNVVHYDILILSNLNNGQHGHCLMHMLKQLGIEATSNEDIRSGQDEIQIIRQNILKSDHFVVISDMDDENSQREEHLISCIHQATSRQNITVVKDVKRPLPELLGVYQFIEMDLDKFGLDDIDYSEDECNNLIALLKKVLLCF